MAKLAFSNADDLYLLVQATGRPARDEKHLHNYFAGYRLNGEWFAPEVREQIEEALKTESFGTFIDRIAAKYEQPMVKPIK